MKRWAHLTALIQLRMVHSHVAAFGRHQMAGRLAGASPCRRPAWRATCGPCRPWRQCCCRSCATRAGGQGPRRWATRRLLHAPPPALPSPALPAALLPRSAPSPRRAPEAGLEQHLAHGGGGGQVGRPEALDRAVGQAAGLGVGAAAQDLFLDRLPVVDEAQAYWEPGTERGGGGEGWEMAGSGQRRAPPAPAAGEQRAGVAGRGPAAGWRGHSGPLAAATGALMTRHLKQAAIGQHRSRRRTCVVARVHADLVPRIKQLLHIVALEVARRGGAREPAGPGQGGRSGASTHGASRPVAQPPLLPLPALLH